MEANSYLYLRQTRNGYVLDLVRAETLGFLAGRSGIWLFASSKRPSEFAVLEIFKNYSTLQEAYDAMVLVDPGIIKMHSDTDYAFLQ
jgi:hypothetical protein